MSWVALVVGWILLAWPWLSGRVTIPWDAKAHFLPQLQFLASSLSQGESPFWTPFVFAGHPQIADPQSLIFSPPFLLLALVDPSPSGWAADVTLYVMILLSAAALLAWAGDQGWHPAAGVLAALAFAFGASMAWRVQHLGQVISLAYLPVVLLFLDRALARKSALYGLGAGLAAGFLVLGRDQVALLSVYFLAGHVVARWWQSADRPAMARAALWPLSAAAIAGLAVIVVPTVLTALVAATSNRPSIDLEGAGRGSLHPALFLTALSPDVFGSSGRQGTYWGPPSGIWSIDRLYIAQNMGVLYLGALPAALLIWGAMSGVLWDRAIRHMLLALIAAAIYGLGRYTPLFAYIHAWVPGVDLYRRPADATFLIGFLGSVLAGYVFDRALTDRRAALSQRVVAAWCAVLATAFATMLALAVHFETLAQAWHDIVIPAALFAASAAMFVWAVRTAPHAPHLVTAVIAAFVIGDLAWSNRPGNATGLSPGTYDVLEPNTKNETIGLLKQFTSDAKSATRRDRVEVVGFGFHWPNAGLTHQLENTLGYNPLRLGLTTRATGAGDHAGLIEQKNFSPLFPSYRSTMADLLGLRYIATSAPIEQIDKLLKTGDLKQIARTSDGYIYENSRALPRVLFANAMQAVDFSSLITRGAWPQIDYQTTVLLEGHQDATPRSGGAASITSYRNTMVSIEADSTEGGWVVLNDVWQPWWFATLDGHDAPVLRANVMFRSIAVPPGHHTITFTFEPLRGAWRELYGGM